MQPANALLPGAGFAVERLLAPEQAVVAYLSRVALQPLGIETVSLDDACGRFLARDVAADDDYPSVERSAMDGFALRAASVPGRLRVRGGVAMGAGGALEVAAGEAVRIPTGGVLPGGADAVVPIEDAAVEGDDIVVAGGVRSGENVVERGADMHRGDAVLSKGRRLGPAQVAVLATLGVVDVPVFRRPAFAVFSSGDELVDASRSARPGEVRDSNRYAIAGSLRAMGAEVRHYPTVSDEDGALETALAHVLKECDGVALTGGSSVGERDRVPVAVAAIGDPGVVVHGVRIKPGKPLLLGAAGLKPILGLPGNPASSLISLEAVAAPIVAALCGGAAPAARETAVLAEPARSRPGWTWYVPVALRDEGGTRVAHPLPLRSFSVSLAARAAGYLVMGENDADWDAGKSVTVHRFLGG